jgi:hypothetical protein
MKKSSATIMEIENSCNRVPMKQWFIFGSGYELESIDIHHMVSGIDPFSIVLHMSIISHEEKQILICYD